MSATRVDLPRSHTRSGSGRPRGLGLYVLKPWYGERLAGLQQVMVSRGMHPDTVTGVGVVFGVLAGIAIAMLPAGWAALVVGPLLAARLAAANLDGSLARATGQQSRRGAVLNEVGDRVAELAVLAGCLAVAPPWLVLLAMLGASAPSWIALAGAATGAPRANGGPVGKTERCLLITVAAALPGAASLILVLIGAGSAVTALKRARDLTR